MGAWVGWRDTNQIRSKTGRTQAFRSANETKGAVGRLAVLVGVEMGACVGAG